MLLGFIDLQSRLAEVVSMLEVGPSWLEPTKFDLTFTNVKTQKCVINNTEVGPVYEGCFLKAVDCLQAFKIIPGNACYTEFFVPEMNLNIVPFPERALLKGKDASFYKVEQVRTGTLIVNVLV